ncbi:efflux transporter outer membrane subunit [Paraburkholderia humisilvae]|uniref:Outer membrane protein OprM n=1 Tax=Paraburkholderia humisilvae TaxID=627669 RepID=A0A6J5CXK7_9BURK|nr:efflux transporter outer membrane subunit [Paraburkholderia humisilvae]CAB3745712.1 Outer membrane protein OprM [Paraburkholderia humisilvae]
MNRLITALVLTGSVAGCAVGPDFQSPVTQTSARFARDEAHTDAGTAVAEPAADQAFWQSFDDPRLTQLVEQALNANNDLRTALASYDRANALLREAKLDQYPIVTASGQAGHQRFSKDQAFGAPLDERNTYTLSLQSNAIWELDLFGRVRRGVEAQRAETAANAADFSALQVAIVGQVASTYVDLRGTQERLRVARENAQNQLQTLQIVQKRLDAGRGSNFDSARARQQYESTLARIPAFEARIAVDEHRLAVLTGNQPGTLSGLDQPQPLPNLPASIDPGTPANLLRRRPDVAAAEYRLHAATARVGVATADLFPRLSIAGMIGTQAFAASSLFTADGQQSLIALGVDWSFLDVGRVRARVVAARADASGLLAQYQQTVLLALEDTENALVVYARAQAEDEQLQRAANDAAEAARLARIRYEDGLIDLFEVLDAERQLLQAQDAFAEGRMRSAGAAVSLYRALAGGWPQRPAADPAIQNAAR